MPFLGPVTLEVMVIGKSPFFYSVYKRHFNNLLSFNLILTSHEMFRQIAFVVVLAGSCVSKSFCEDKYAITTLSKICQSSFAYSVTCLKFRVVSWIDTLGNSESYPLLPGVSIVRENATSEEFKAETKHRSSQNALDNLLASKVSWFVHSHAIKLHPWNFYQNHEETRGMKDGKGKGGDKGMGMVLAMGAMMKGMLLALALGALAALAGKALMVSLISLMLSMITGLKSLVAGKSGMTTYEVVAKPIYSQSHTQSVSHEDLGSYGHGRNFEERQMSGQNHGRQR
ncbi:uncharacterized protein LOC132703202 [Cylas formicarius]|uniref:uncharacterized protein LOC132703202 n=1 Tax=Cylas formicarius TaxID=197179 RepID=UPI002958989E|nr:uncharacterized protein LOC132703202 [Cylas formicarius]